MIAETGEPELPEVDVVVTESEDESLLEGEEDVDEEDGEDISDADPVTYDEGEEGDTEPEEPVDGDPEPVALIPVTPEAPVVSACGDASAIQLPTTPVEVVYSLVDNGNGSFVVEARLIDSETNTWSELIEPWSLEEDVAKMSITLVPCPGEDISDAVEEESTEPDDVDSEESVDSELREPSAMNAPMAESANISIHLEPWPAGTVWPGRSISYHVYVTNNGTDPVAFELTGQLSKHVIFTDFQSLNAIVDCSYDAGVHYINCSPPGDGQIASNESRLYGFGTQLSFDDPEVCPATIAFTASVMENNTASYIHQVTCAPPNTSVMSTWINPLDPGPVIPGDTITYALSVYSPATLGLSFQTYTSLPDEVEFVSAAPYRASVFSSCDDVAEDHTVKCELLPVGSGGGRYEYLITVRVKDRVDIGTCPETLDVSVEGSWTENNTASASNELICDPYVSISRSVDPITVAEDGSVSYDLILTEEGGSADTVTVIELLPLRTAGYNWSAQGCEIDGTVITCSDINVPAGGQVIIPITGSPDPDLPAAVCGTDRVSGYIVGDPNETPDLVETNIVIPCDPQYSWTKSVIAEFVNPGDTAGFVLDFKNTGNTEFDINIADALPELPGDLEWDILANAGIKVGASCNGQERASFTTPSELDCEVTEIRPGSYIEIFATYTVPEDIGIDSAHCGTFTNTATATTISPFSQTLEHGRTLLTDLVETNVDTNTAAYHVNCTEVSIQKAVSGAVIDVDGSVTYIITVTNNGNTVINDVLVEDDVFEASAVFNNWRVESDEADDCEVADVIRCEFESIAASDSVTMTITADAPEIPTVEQCEPVSNVASFSYQSADAPEMLTGQSEQTPPQTRIVSNAVITMLDCQPELSINKVAVQNPGEDDYMDAGDTIAYTITVANIGNMTVFDIDVTDELIDDNAWTDAGSTIQELLPGESATFTAEYSVTADDITVGEVTNTASVQGVLSLDDEEPDFASIMTIHAFGMVMMQVPNDLTVSAEVTIVTRLQVAPEVEPTPPATPDSPATPEATQAPESITGLPSTGTGSSSVVMPLLWTAAIIGVIALGIRFGTAKHRAIQE